MITLRAFAIATIGLIGAGFPAAAPAPATEGTVLSLLVRPDTQRVDVLVGVKGNVTTTDFTLHGPEKIVVDIANASLGMARNQSYDRAARGGIVNVHYAQYKVGVVRVVLTLDAPHPYTVSRQTDGIRIRVTGQGSNLPAWAVGYVNAARAAAPAPSPNKVIATRMTTPIGPTASHGDETMVVNGKRMAVTQIQSQARRITVNFEDMPIVEVLKVFSQYSGHSILASSSVKGTVSASITDVPWDVALKAILNLNGYDASVDQYGIITVNSISAAHQEDSFVPLSSRQIKFNYVGAAAIAEAIKGRLSRQCPTTTATPANNGIATGFGDTSRAAPPAATPQPVQIVTTGNCQPRGTISVDTLSNSVSVADIETNLDAIEQYARSLDVPQPQVNIKAKIILVDRTSLEGLGLRYDLGTQDQFFNAIVPRNDSAGNAQTGPGQIVLGGNAISAIANAALRVPGASLQLAYSTALGAFDFTTFMEALTSTSLLDVQAEPNGTVLNNHTLNLTAGTDVPIRTTEPGAGGNAAGNLPTVTVSVRSTGVILNVTPRVTSDNKHVQMRIHVENSSATFSGTDATAFPKQSVDNEVLLADGVTWVIGGLTQTDVTYSRSGIPLLSDLPVIGRLFGVTNRQEQKRDLLITITPHIVDPGQDGASGHPPTSER